MKSVGINFGSGFCAVAVTGDGQRIEVITNDIGNRSYPTTISFAEKEVLICEPAVARAHKNSAGTIFNIRDFLGLKFSDKQTKILLERTKCQCLATEDDLIVFSVHFEGKIQKISPERIFSFFLQKLISTAADFIGSDVSSAVIAVPRSFSVSQRSSILKASKYIGLEVLQLVNEPSAAALSYGLDLPDHYPDSVERMVMIIDIGSLSCDISILSVKNGIFQFRGSFSSTTFCGSVLDDELLHFFVQKFERQTKIDIRERPKSLLRLRTATERAKCVISRSPHSDIALDSLCDGIDFHSRITRARFEVICFEKIILISKCIENCLNEANITKDQIFEVLLVGGTTLVPKVEEVIVSFFGRNDITKKSKRISPEEAIARGAAIQASLLTEDRAGVPNIPNGERCVASGKLCNFSLRTTSLNIGVEIAESEDEMKPIIPAGSFLPCSVTRKFSVHNLEKTSDSNAYLIRIFEGNRDRIKDNHFLGQIKLPQTDVSGDSQIVVKVVISLEGKLKVSVLPNLSNIELTISHCDKSDLNQLQTQLIEESKQNFDDSKLKSATTVDLSTDLSEKFEKTLVIENGFEPEITLDSDEYDNSVSDSTSDTSLNDENDDLD